MIDAYPESSTAIPEAVRSVFETLPSPVHFFRDDNSNVWVNRAMNDLLGYGDGELAELDTTDIYFEYDKDNHARLVEDFVDLGYAKGEIEVRRKDGRSIQIAFLSTANVLPGVHLTIWDPPISPILRHDHFDWPSLPIPSRDRLTDRETQAITLVADGAGNAQIAAALGIAGTTVQQHLDSCRAKLGASNRAEMVSRAIARGSIESKRPGEVLLVLAPDYGSGEGRRTVTVTYSSPAATAERPALARLVGTRIEMSDHEAGAESTSDPTDDRPQSGIEFSGNGHALLSGMLSEIFGMESAARETEVQRDRSFLSIHMH